MMILAELARRFAPWIALAMLVLIIALVGPSTCRKLAQESARARLGEESARAATGSGRDAVATVGAAARREAQSSDLTRTNEQEIRNAQGAAVPVDPAVRDAGIGGLCRRPAYRDHERCRLRRAAAE
ncbi:MAG: hypothetical protein V4696_11040 [Pseudomonadota bacterium]